MRRVYLSSVAEIRFTRILEYLSQEWSENDKLNFISVFKDNVELIRRFPNICAVSEQMPEIHRCVVNRQTSFYYKIEDDSIQIITITDNRQDPNTTLHDLFRFTK